jgi:transposase
LLDFVLCEALTPAVQAWRDRMEVMHKWVAGLDVHKDTVVACVRLVGRGNKVARECQTFATTTDGLRALLSWLVVSRCSHVAMEATGV